MKTKSNYHYFQIMSILKSCKIQKHNVSLYRFIETTLEITFDNPSLNVTWQPDCARTAVSPAPGSQRCRVGGALLMMVPKPNSTVRKAYVKKERYGKAAENSMLVLRARTWLWTESS